MYVLILLRKFSTITTNAIDCIHLRIGYVNYYNKAKHSAFPPLFREHFLVISRCICVHITLCVWMSAYNSTTIYAFISDRFSDYR